MSEHGFATFRAVMRYAVVLTAPQAEGGIVRWFGQLESKLTKNIYNIDISSL